jgi:hypothetical protein
MLITSAEICAVLQRAKRVCKHGCWWKHADGIERRNGGNDGAYYTANISQTYYR